MLSGRALACSCFRLVIKGRGVSLLRRELSKAVARLTDHVVEDVDWSDPTFSGLYSPSFRFRILPRFDLKLSLVL